MKIAFQQPLASGNSASTCTLACLTSASSHRVQLDNAMTVAYICHQGGTRSYAVQEEQTCFFPGQKVTLCSYTHSWTDFHICPQLNPGEWALHLEVFAEIYLYWGMSDANLLEFKSNNKLESFFVQNQGSLYGKCPGDLLESVFL